MSQVSIYSHMVYRLINKLDNLVPTFSKTKGTFLDYNGLSTLLLQYVNRKSVTVVAIDVFDL